MTQASLTVQAIALRPAMAVDIDAICTIWHRGWRDAHLGHVPAALHRHRRLDDFHALVPARLVTTTVATIDLEAEPIGEAVARAARPAGPRAGNTATARRDGVAYPPTSSAVVGFVTVHDDEIEQIYVDASARGTGVASALLAHGETVIRAASDRAWLAVVAGNARARRFYERNGWCDTGPFVTAAPTAQGTTIPVPARRYEKRLTSIDASSETHRPT